MILDNDKVEQAVKVLDENFTSIDFSFQGSQKALDEKDSRPPKVSYQAIDRNGDLTVVEADEESIKTHARVALELMRVFLPQEPE